MKKAFILLGLLLLAGIFVQNTSAQTVSATGSLLPFAYCAGSVSAEQSFTVTGSSLSGDITITAPTGFEVSTTSGSAFAGSLAISPLSGTVSPTIVYVRVASTATGSISGNISVVSTGATPQNIAASGFSGGAAFYALGNTFTVILGCSGSLTVTSSGTSYSFSLGSGSWTGAATGASAVGSTLTINATGLSNYDTFAITDGAAGAAVTLGNSGANAYSDNFTVTLDHVAGAVSFNGTSSFSGSNSLTVTTDRNIVFNPGSSLTSDNGALTLSANMQALSSSFNANGIYINNATVQSLSTGLMTLKGKAGTGSTYPFYNKGILVRDGGKVLGGTTGQLTVEGYGDPLNTSKSNNGILIEDASSMISSIGGNVSVIGTAGGSNTDYNDGVFVHWGGIISAGGTGSVNVTGYGGYSNGSTYYNSGIYISDSGSKITSEGGNVTVHGTGGGSGSSEGNIGVCVPSQGTITAGGNGTVTVTGKGGNNTAVGTGSDNYGISIVNSGVITSNNGNVYVTGTGGGDGGSSGSNRGVNMWTGGKITAGGNTSTVSVTGRGGNSSGGMNNGVFIQSENTQITSAGGDVTVTCIEGTGSGFSALYINPMAMITTEANGGNVTVIANSIMMYVFNSTITTDASHTLNLLQYTNGVAYNLGAEFSGATDGPIELSPAAFSYLSSGTINIGNANSGSITISQAVTTTSNLKLSSPAACGVLPLDFNTDLTMTGKTLSFASGTPLKISITSAYTYDQLAVAGSVDLSGSVLSLSGSYTPVEGDVFTIVWVTSLSNTFNGLADGDFLTFNGKSLRINYTSTTVTLTTTADPLFTPATFTVANLQATGSTGGAIIKWYDAATAGNLLASGTVLQNGYDYYASQTVNGVESSARFKVTVTLDPTPCAPTGAVTQSLVAGSTVASLTAPTGTNIRWYYDAVGGTALDAATVLVNGHTYYATQTIGGTESAGRLGVTVSIL